MADKDDSKESGARWWFKNVIVPIVGSGGIVAVIVAIVNRPSQQPSAPQPSPQSVSTTQQHDDKTTPPKVEDTLPVVFSVDYPLWFLSDQYTDHAQQLILTIDDLPQIVLRVNSVTETATTTVTVRKSGWHHYTLQERSSFTRTTDGHADEVDSAGEGNLMIFDNDQFKVVRTGGANNEVATLVLEKK